MSMFRALFRRGDFISAAGLPMSWKIECDALSPEDWACIAHAALPIVGPFRKALGVPRGGIPLADAFQQYAEPDPRLPLLLCDDVWTTGKSMHGYALKVVPAFSDGVNVMTLHPWKGFVAFHRGARELPDYVSCFARIFPG